MTASSAARDRNPAQLPIRCIQPTGRAAARRPGRAEHLRRPAGSGSTAVTGAAPAGRRPPSAQRLAGDHPLRPAVGPSSSSSRRRRPRRRPRVLPPPAGRQSQQASRVTNRGRAGSRGRAATWNRIAGAFARTVDAASPAARGAASSRSSAASSSPTSASAPGSSSVPAVLKYWCRNVGRPDAQHAAPALGQPVRPPGGEVVDGRRERDADQQQPDGPHPQVAERGLASAQTSSTPANARTGNTPWPTARYAQYATAAPAVPAQVLRRRVRVDRVARPVGRAEAPEAQQQERPDARRRGRRRRCAGVFHAFIGFLS